MERGDTVKIREISPEEWQRGYEAGYYYGRLDAMNGAEYDSTPPWKRDPAEKEKTHTDDPWASR